MKLKTKSYWWFLAPLWTEIIRVRIPLLFFAFLPFFSKAQKTGSISSDSLEIVHLEGEIDSLMANSYFEEALNQLYVLKPRYNKLEQTVEELDTERRIIHCLQILGQLKTAHEKADSLLLKVEKSLGSNHPFLSSIYTQLGSISYFEGELSQAKENWEKGILYLQDSSDKERSNLYFNLAGVSSKLGDIKKALEYQSQSLIIDKRLYGEEHPYIADHFSNRGAFLYELGYYDSALFSYESAVQLLDKLDSYRSPHYGRVLQGMSLMKNALGELGTSKELARAALRYDKEIYGDSHVNTIYDYAALALAHQSANEQDSAIFYYKKSKSQWDERGAIIYTDYARCEIALTHLYTEINQPDSAIYFGYSAIDLLIKADYEGELFPRFYTVLANAFFAQNLLDSAESYYTKSIESYGTSQSHFSARSNLGLAKIQMIRNKLSNGLDFAQKALEINSIRFNSKNHTDLPHPSDYFDPSLRLEVLSIKGDLFEKMYINSKDPIWIDYIIENYYQLHDFLQSQRHEYSSLADQEEIEFLSKSAYEKAIKNCLLGIKKHNKDKYISECFKLIEQNKSGILALKISEKNALEQIDISDNLKKDFLDTKKALALYKKNLLELSSEDLEKNKRVRAKIVQLEKLNRLNLSKILKEYPEYLKYRNSISTLSVVQDKLSDDDVLIEYFSNNDEMYFLLISQSEADLISLNNYDELYTQVQKLKKATYSPTGNINSLKQSSKKLYELLIYNIQDKLRLHAKRLIFIPDDFLSQIPFEILINRDDQYLIENFSICYGYSASYVFRNNVRSDYDTKFVGFAPNYSMEYSENRGGKNDGKLWEELSHNKQEVESLANMLEGSSFVSSDASESAFKNLKVRPKILHLAMHALSDNKDPMKSKLIFSSPSDSIEDGYLYSYEIIGSTISSELAVLSACGTGAGPLGSDVNSLSYAFSYAGCPSVLLSMWQVNDFSTKQLMISFYQKLEEGLPKDEALRYAKLEFINSNDELMSHPFLWAPFIITGDIRPVDDQLKTEYLLILILAIVFIVIFLIKKSSPFTRKESKIQKV